MRTWLRIELLDPDLLSEIDSMLVSDFVTFGDECVKVADGIHRRDLRELMLAVKDVPMLFELVQRVRSRDDLQDKFWRYLTLFMEVTQQASFQPDSIDGTKE